MYSDAHTHITGNPFGENVLTPQELQTLFARDREAGIALMVAGGTDLATSERLVEIANVEQMVYVSIAIHPWIAAPFDKDTYEAFKALAQHPRVVAMGEIGLDDVRSRSSKEAQMECLSQLFRLGRETGLPPIVHENGMHKELMGLIHQEKPPVGVMHGFAGSLDELAEWLDLGYSVTVGCAILAPEGGKLKEMVRLIPDDRLLLESDGAKRTTEGTVMGQERVVQVAQVVAEWRGSTGPAIGALTTANLKRILKI